jgi:aryl-alcohol dehydrogenase-like predicted oxidoreductase
MEVSVLGFGASEIGYEGASEETVARLLGSALDAGLNVIDTAECYPGSEELIGKTISGRRDEFSLFTKGGHPAGMGSADWSGNSLIRTLERSLRLLRTDHVDLFQLHSCSEEVLQRGEAIEALRTARERGLTRFIGYSGEGRAALFAVECGEFDTLQTSISIADQESIDLTVGRARERKMGVIAKRPIANAAWKSGCRPENSYNHVYWDRLEALRYPFLGGELPDAVGTALRFTLSVAGVHTAIVGTVKPGRWEENASHLEDGPLPADQFEAIRARWREVADESWVGQV